MKLTSIKNAVTRRGQKGVTMIEYALIAALIAVAAIAALTALGGDLTAIFTKVGCQIKGGTGC